MKRNNSFNEPFTDVKIFKAFFARFWCAKSLYHLFTSFKSDWNRTIFHYNLEWRQILDARKSISCQISLKNKFLYLTFHFMRIINPPQSHCLRKGKPAELLGLFDWWILWMMVTCNGWTISWIFMDEPTFFS